MEPGRLRVQGQNTGSDLDSSSAHETSSSTTTTANSTRRYSIAGVIRSIFHAVLVQDTDHLDHVLSSLSLDPNSVRDREGKTMLMVAATENKHRVVRYLLTLPSLNMDLQDEEGETALYQAAAAGSTECVQLLLLAGASASIGNEESITPLIIASYNGFVAICRLLITIGHAQVNQQDNSQKSALLLASYAGHVEVMAELINHGASLNMLDQYGWSALMLAAYAGKIEACRLLLAQGANPHIKTANGKNARSLAWDAGHKAAAVFISKSLAMNNSSSSTAGPSSSMSSRTFIQQMLPSAPRSPSRRTHSPVPSLPSVPEESLEETNHETRRSFSAHNSTISRQSAISSRIGSRRPLQIVTSPAPPKIDDDGEPVSPIPTAMVSGHLVNMFNNPSDINSIESGADEASSASTSRPRQDVLTAPPRSVPASMPTSESSVNARAPEGPKKREQSKPTPSAHIYSVRRHGIIPRYGSRHLHYQLEEQQPENQSETEGVAPNAECPYRFRLQRSSNSASERSKEKRMEDSLNQRLLRRQRSLKRSRNYAWTVLSRLLTFCCPIRIFPRSWSKDRCQDWREKIVLGILLTALSIVFGLFAIGLPLLTCWPHSASNISVSDFRLHYGNSSRADYPGRLMAIRGVVHDVGKLFADGRHPSIAGNNFTQASLNIFMNTHFGTDISFLFFPSTDLGKSCNLLGASTNFGKCVPTGNESIYHCHPIQASADLLQAYSRSDIRIVYEWSDIQQQSTLGRALFVYDGYVFDATDYLAQGTPDSMTDAERMQMDWILSLVGRDVTLTVQRRSDHKNIAACFHGYFKVGVLAGQTNGCIASIVINTLTLAILLLTTILRLASALYYRWISSRHHVAAGKDSSDMKGESHVMMLVTCQVTDTEDQIKSTLDSLVLADYDDSRKLLLVIADATLDSAGELCHASLSCLRILNPSAVSALDNEKGYQGGAVLEQDVDPFVLGGCEPSISTRVADTTRTYSGHYVVDTRRVPYVLVIRPPKTHGADSLYEAWQKKRLVIQWLHRVCFNEPMSAFEFGLSEKVRELNREGPGLFEMLLTVKVGSVSDQGSVDRLVKTLEGNVHIMGIGGHGLVANRTRNWLTRLQDYESHLSLQFRSAFESTFGALQCLSGRFSIVRIKINLSGAHEVDVRLSKRPSEEASSMSAADGVDDRDDDLEVQDKNAHDDYSNSPRRHSRRDASLDKIQYFVPILIHPDVVSSFVQHKARTLHERRLVLRNGDDQFLTGLLHRTFPSRKIVYLPNATYHYSVTTDLPTYLREQRLLWISSFHNLWIQIWSSRLRGFSCCSINFLAFLEWLSLVLHPMTIALTWALVAIVAVGVVTNEGALYSLPTVLALAFMLSSTILQPILVIFLGRWVMIADLLTGLTLFLLTLPFKCLIVAVYTFWGFDVDRLEHMTPKVTFCVEV
ncbi:hypothetical protein BGX34_012092 [Mortierella sp. NVP85]|nr:hypothetical protein BGX34_012092 [Mortierella sp. NVP85]